MRHIMMSDNNVTEPELSEIDNVQGKFFIVENGVLLRRGEKTEVANFYVKIQGHKIILDEGEIRGRILDLRIHLDEEIIPLQISSDDFLGHEFIKKVMEVAGPRAILYGSPRDLGIAAQELSGDVPERLLTTSIGLTEDGYYLSSGMMITPEGIIWTPDVEVDLSGGTFAKKLGFLYPDESLQPGLAKHILEDFLELKEHDITYPLMGHICLAPFTSVIPDFSGKRKAAMHLQGASGTGKTFLGILAMSFFGTFDDRVLSWSSTPNALEMEGYFFRDALFLIDDFKASTVDQRTMIRILHGYTEGHGRSRLSSTSKILDPPHIRGHLLSSGEDFVGDVESITGRTIVLHIDPQKNVAAGQRCWENRAGYRMVTPGLIRHTIADRSWKNRFKQFLDEKGTTLGKETAELPNGLRIASNWALNSLGFELFLDYMANLSVIDQGRREEMAAEYGEIALAHLREQARDLKRADPVEVFFRILAQKLATGGACIPGLADRDLPNRGKIIGYGKDYSVVILPDVAMEILATHFRSIGQRLPFSRNALRDALAHEGLIERPKPGRWAKQFRLPEGRRMGWEFDRAQFVERCGFEEELFNLSTNRNHNGGCEGG